MTRHPRARVFGAGVFLAVVGGSLLIAASPAHAVDPTVTITGLGSGSLRSGETTRLSFAITNPTDEGQSPSVDIVVSGDGVSCAGGSRCDFTEVIPPGQSKQYQVELVAGEVRPGDQKNGSVQISATAGGDTGDASRRITVRGPDAVQRIDGLKGRVRDKFNAGVPGALVAYVDSAGRRGEATSDGNGNYSFPSTDQNPIAPGRIDIGAQKDGFDDFTTTVTGQAGRNVTANLTLGSAAATPTATPTATPSATIEPSEEVVDEVVPEATPGTPALQAAGDEEGSSSMIFIIAGALLVAVGSGAIVLVFMRRKDKDEDDDGPAAVPAAAPAQRYGADATRVAPRTGGGMPAADATMVTTGAAIPPALANAQTMLHQAVPADDEFPDPYGVPARPVSGTHTQTWNPPAGGPYGAAAPAAPAYGTPAAPPPPQRYEDPAGTRGASYPQQGGTYGGTYGSGVRPDEPYQSGGYGGGYEQPPPPPGAGYGGGIDAGGGYGGGRGTGTYGGGTPQAGGYDEPTTYGRPAPGSGAYGGGGYEPPQHQQPPAQQPGGAYGTPRGGYDEQTGYYAGAPDQQQPPPEQPGRRGGYEREDYDRPPPQGGQRRSLDWLDD